MYVAAIIILFASISEVETLAWGLAKQGVGLALRLVPLFCWRWTRDDQQGSHPLISRLAIKVYDPVDIEQGPILPPMLLDEMSNTTLHEQQEQFIAAAQQHYHYAAGTTGSTVDITPGARSYIAKSYIPPHP